ncbi:thioredoxin family protein [Ruficoccus amylovorans]|uniref:Thioredoxin family protein n=1 Tax=Ruficoccus amylovorans TaxID=1804625 RepID=A0A842HGG9_9BACT|nr:thioredoxin family protein [Ruficoccus amylovorans]MBC2595389.1 thioredoxin family protein [Ruficoccus amylovorans]
MRSPVFILLCLLLVPALTGFKRPALSQHTQIELVSETDSLAPGSTAWLALRMKMDPGWHTYWINPGEFGETTKVTWDRLPAGVEAGPFRWPAPHIYEQAGIINYVFESEVFLLFPVTLGKDFKGQSLTLNGHVTWLECDENECVPGRGTVTLTLPVKPGQPSPGKWASAFEKTRQTWPQDLSAQWSVNAHTAETGFVLTLTPHGDANPTPEDVYFFSREPVTAPAQPQVFQPSGNGTFTLEVVRSEYAPDDIKTLRGVLHSQNGWLAEGGPTAMRVDAELGTEPPAASSGTQTPLAVLLGFAFTGGLILNLMPCVFPVLGLKIMGFVKQGGESQGRIFAHGLVYTLGVLLSFWALAAVLLVLRAGGEQLGWGFQLQSTGFVLGMTVVLLAFALNMSGVFEVGMSAVGVGSNLTARSGLSGSFFSGVLATLVATPCAAPFLAPALGAALALPPVQSVLLFTVIGLGLSFPYLFFSIVPKLAKILPRPGAWMDTFKKWLAFLLYATVAYLVWILAGLVEAERFLNLLFALVGVALACWLYGHYGAFARKGRSLGIAGALIVLVASLGVGFYSPPKDLVWQTWSPELVKKLRTDKRIIYVDFTARWCATCQVNKRVVFTSEEVLEAMKEDNVALLKADWTAQDPAITAALASFGKSAVPFNIIYSPHLDKPLELPSLLTPGIVLDALDRATGHEQDDD